MSYQLMIRQALSKAELMPLQTIHEILKGKKKCIQLARGRTQALMMEKEIVGEESTLRLFELNDGESVKYVQVFANPLDMRDLSSLRISLVKFLKNLLLTSNVLKEYGYEQDGFNHWLRKGTKDWGLLSVPDEFVIGYVHRFEFHDEETLRHPLIRFEKSNMSYLRLSMLSSDVRDSILLNA